MSTATTTNPTKAVIEFDDKSVRYFMLASIIWGLVGMLVGVLIASQMNFRFMNFDTSFLTFGRLRPLHTNAVIFAFVGNMMFAGIYYSTQRLCKARMASDLLSKIHFWGWQFIIVCAAITLPLGLTRGQEYAELIWPINIMVALIWVVFAVNFFWTLHKRNEPSLYVALWFYIATIVTIAMLYIVNHLSIPTSFTHSYSIWAGVKGALIQWWYGHNAVAFFLTTPFLGIMYYFIPKAANRPVYSYKLSIVHFWGLVFIYIWAGPHHLLYTSLPDWAQSLGTAFSVMLIAPSWGGMINGLLTLRGAWDRVRQDPVLKFMVVGVTAYGMSTFEGPMMSLKNVNALTHYTDYIIGHVHLGALAWNGGLAAAMLYFIIPRLWGKPLYSMRMANFHFWISTIGIVFYAIPMYWGGITQSLMWKQFTAQGALMYPNFLDTVTQIIPMYIIRSVGGTLYLTGFLVMAYNMIKTMRSGTFVPAEEASAPSLKVAMAHVEKSKYKHRILERKPLVFTGLTLVAVIIGGVIEFVPVAMVRSNIPTIASVKPYSPLELEGRDIYIREGCNNCHSQMIRPFRSETERYGEYSKAGEFVYDHPFLWGSKRTGPDLHRVGGKYNHAWHYQHMKDPRITSPGSIMPAYPWLFDNDLDTSLTTRKIRALAKIGVDYPPFYENKALTDLNVQASQIADALKKDNMPVAPGKEIVAMIAYLQRLGIDIKAK